MNKNKLIKLINLIIIISIFILLILIYKHKNINSNNPDENINKNNEAINIYDNYTYNHYLCPKDSCYKSFKNFKYEKINCLLYSLDSFGIKLLTKEFTTNSTIYLYYKSFDNLRYYLELENYSIDKIDDKIIKINNTIIYRLYSNNLMHIKYCSFDNSKVFLGSLNPTKDAFFSQTNDFLIIESKKLANILNQYLIDNFDNCIKKNDEFLLKKDCIYGNINNINLYYSNKDINKNITPNYQINTNYIKIYLKDILENLLKEINETYKIKKIDNVSNNTNNRFNILSANEIYSILYYLTLDSFKKLFENHKKTNIILYQNGNNIDIKVRNKTIIDNFMIHNKLLFTKYYFITGSYNPTNNAQNHNYEINVFINDLNSNKSLDYTKNYNELKEYYQKIINYNNLLNYIKRQTNYSKIINYISNSSNKLIEDDLSKCLFIKNLRYDCIGKDSIECEFINLTNLNITNNYDLGFKTLIVRNKNETYNLIDTNLFENNFQNQYLPNKDTLLILLNENKKICDYLIYKSDYAKEKVLEVR